MIDHYYLRVQKLISNQQFEDKYIYPEIGDINPVFLFNQLKDTIAIDDEDFAWREGNFNIDLIQVEDNGNEDITDSIIISKVNYREMVDNA